MSAMWHLGAEYHVPLELVGTLVTGLKLPMAGTLAPT
jgi:hypothetical protein